MTFPLTFDVSLPTFLSFENKELKEMCKLRMLSTDGQKEDRAERLCQHYVDIVNDIANGSTTNKYLKLMVCRGRYYLSFAIHTAKLDLCRTGDYQQYWTVLKNAQQILHDTYRIKYTESYSPECIPLKGSANTDFRFMKYMGMDDPQILNAWWGML